MTRLNLILGASGSGKTTLGERLEKEFGVQKIVSHTTRRQRSGEVDGQSYHFVTKEGFAEIDFIETTKYDGNFYGVSVNELKTKLQSGTEQYAILNMEGVLKVKELFPDLVRIIYIDINYDVLKERMEKRGDNPILIEQRLKTVKKYNECENHRYADIIVNNNGELESAWQELKKHF